MIAMQNIEGTREARRIEGPYLDAGLTQRAPEAARRAVERAHPVMDQPDAHPGTRARSERIRELGTGLVIANEVVLEDDAMLCAVNRREPRRIVFARILQQPHAVAVHERSARRAGERTIEQGRLD